MSEFDRFGHDYRDRLEDSIGGLGSVDSALKSKVQVLRRITASDEHNEKYRTLDFGCGTGLLSGALREFSSSVTGVDVSIGSLRNSQADMGRFVLFDGQQLPFQDHSFDLVVASCVFHHIPPDLRAPVLMEIKRILSPQGILTIIEHNPFNPVTRFVVNRCEFDEDAILLTLSGTRKMLATLGYEPCVHGFFYAVPPVNAAFSRLDSLFSGLPLGAQYYCAVRKGHGGED